MTAPSAAAVGRRRHVQLDADGGAELLDRFHPLCRGGAGDDDPLRIVAASAGKVGDHDDDGQRRC